MLKKTILFILSLLSLCLLFSIQVFAIGCDFDTYNSSCTRFSSSFNSFNLNFAPIDNYESFSAKLYNKYNPSNQILIDIDLENKQIKNINPFVEPGVYILEVTSYNKGKKSNLNSFEYIFDNLRPMPPVISSNLHSTSSEVLVNGKTEEKTIRVIAEIKDKGIIETQSVNGEFTLNLNNLDSGLNYVKFYTISENGLKSFVVERIIVSNEIVEMNLENANNIIISNLEINERTYFNNIDNEYYTTKQNFYVTGTANGQNGAEIYVNTQRAVFDGNKYGAFILLNNGENEVVIQSGIETKTIIVNYIDVDFHFLQFDDNKVFEGDFILKGNATVNLPFEIYLNGVYLDKNSNYNIEDAGVYSFEYIITADKLKPGKNYLYIEGYNNEYLSKIIYKDIESPKIELLSFEKIANKKELAFKITDDITAEDRTLNLNFGPGTLSQASTISGDIYVFDVTQFIDETTPQENYDYTLTIEDLTGKETSISGTILVNSENTLIESFSSSQKNVYSYGNKLFIPNANVELIVKPSKAIAFKKIYLDGVEQINYIILRDNTILLNISTEKKTGEIKFIFINQTYQEFEQKYTYYSKLEEPEVKLDYIINPYTKDSEYVLVTGEIIDSNFNWSSLKFNGIDNNYQRYGNYFEARVIPNNNGLNSLIISGSDYSKNVLSKQYSNLITKDTTQSGVSIYSTSNIFSASLLSTPTTNVPYSDVRMKNYLYDFDFPGFDVEKTYLQNQFELSLPQRNGVHILTLKGVESSGQLFQKSVNLTLDSFNPNIYLFYNQTSSKYMIVVDGTYSAVDTSKVNITSNNTNLDISTCTYKPQYIFYGYCRYLDNLTGINTIQVYADDISKNSKIQIFNLSDAVNVSLIPTIDTDNDGILNNDDPDVNGDDNVDNFEEEIGDGTGDVDGDGTSDIDEGDIDGDGISNGDDSDVNGDGISNDDNINSSCLYQTENISLTYDTITNSNNLTIIGGFIIDGCNAITVNVTNGFNESVGTCNLGQNSFICNVLLNEGDNILKVVITGANGNSINEVVVIKKDTEVPQISINSITGNAIYKVNDNLYYINTPNLIINLNLSERAIITLITNGVQELKGQNSGIFNINVDLTSDINLAENKSITLQIKAKDGAENEGFSEIITLIYNRVAKIFVQVSVE